MNFDAVGIVCQDHSASAAFYTHLGLDVNKVGGDDHMEATTSSGVRIMLDSESLMKKINPQWQRPQGGGVILGFVQDSPEHVDEVVTTLKRAGYEVVKEPWDAFWGQRYATVLDPDGNPIDLFAGL